MTQETHEHWFFGYGSLVNRDTHSYEGALPARLSGWRRAWRHTPLRQIAYLTAVPAPGSVIEGLIAPVPGGDWAALDEREDAYDRVAAAHQVEHTLPDSPQIAVYAIPSGRHAPPSDEGPVLLSYLDVVLQGYLREFGESGVRRFVETTDGWEDAPILDDRATPRYPRHCRLSSDERMLVDDALRGIGARVVRGT